MSSEGLAHQAPVLGELSRVSLGAELVEQPRRALDIGEEEGDHATRKLPHLLEQSEARATENVQSGALRARRAAPFRRIAVSNEIELHLLQ
jgi:hypothetical protein